MRREAIRRTLYADGCRPNNVSRRWLPRRWSLNYANSATLILQQHTELFIRRVDEAMTTLLILRQKQ